MIEAAPGGMRQRARRLRRGQTSAETVLWMGLRNRGLDGYKFHRQHVVGRYVVDFVCREQRLIVEVDGGQHDAAAPAEAARTRWLVAQGYRVQRFWNNDVLTNMSGVLDIICAALRARQGNDDARSCPGGFPSPSRLRGPLPLPAGEGMPDASIHPLPPGEGASASERVRGSRSKEPRG